MNSSQTDLKLGKLDLLDNHGEKYHPSVQKQQRGKESIFIHSANIVFLVKALF